MFRNASDAQFIPIKGAFSKGLVDNLQNEEIRDSNASYLRNARIEGFGTKIRNGYSLANSCPSYPIGHLGYWNKKDTDGTDKNLLVYAQFNSTIGSSGQPGFWDIDANSCITAIAPTKAYWLGPMTMTYTTTPSEDVSFRSELGSFAPVAISDPNNNLVQQFDPSAAKNFDEFFDFVINYPNETIADWNMITNGVIHVDYGDGLIRDMIMDFSGDASMLDVYIRIGNAFTNLTRWGTITTGYFKLNGSDVGPINLSAVTTPEGISAAINTVATYALTYIRYGVNDSGERVPYIVFVNTGLTSIDKSTTGQGALMWELMGGDQLISSSQFVSTRLQNVRMGSVDRKIYGSHSSNSYYFYSVDAAMKGFYVVDNDYNQRLCLKPNGITPQLGCIFDSFHFIAGDPANASDLYQSVRSYYEDFESPGSDTYNFDGPITALATNNKEMYVFTKTSLGLLQAGGFTSQGGIYRYNIQQLETLEGALHQAGVVAVGARTFFWTPGNKIKVVGRSADGLYEVADLSHREGDGIDLTMQVALNADQSTMFGVYSPKENIVKWFCRSTAGTYNDMAIIYDIEHDTWLVDTYNQTIFIAGAQDSKNLYIAGRSGGSIPSTAPKIYKDATGALDDIADYDMLLYTKRWMFGDPTLQKQFWGGRLFMDMKTGSTIDMEIWVDGAKVYEATLSAANGDATPGNRPLDTNTVELCYTITKGMLRAKGKNIQFKFVRNSDGAQVTIKSLSILVLGLPQETSYTNNSN